jgi:hypothetical protein
MTNNELQMTNGVPVVRTKDSVPLFVIRCSALVISK